MEVGGAPLERLGFKHSKLAWWSMEVGGAPLEWWGFEHSKLAWQSMEVGGAPLEWWGFEHSKLAWWSMEVGGAPLEWHMTSRPTVIKLLNGLTLFPNSPLHATTTLYETCSHSQTLCVPFAKTNSFLNSFFCQTPSLWNSLPQLKSGIYDLSR